MILLFWCLSSSLVVLNTLIELIQESELHFPVVDSNLGAFLATTHAFFALEIIIFLSEFNSNSTIPCNQNNRMLCYLCCDSIRQISSANALFMLPSEHTGDKTGGIF